ncbi:MAG: hypothetical protein QMB08_09185 [Acidimicrobiales bacterium]|jgi:hypothetical protein
MTPEELVSATAGKINSLGAIYYFHRDTIAHGKEQLGLDGMRFYFIGRGGVLGDVEAPVVTSAFGYFAPPVVAKMWNTSKEKVAPRDAAQAALGCNAALGRGKLDDIAGLAEFCAAAEQVIADVNPAGLQLYAAVAAEPLPADLPGRAMQLAVIHRELRGSAHLAAVIVAGVHPSVAHAIRRPNDIGTFGWPDDLMITDDDRLNLVAADAATDKLSAGHYAGLSDEQRSAFVTGIDAMGDILL